MYTSTDNRFTDDRFIDDRFTEDGFIDDRLKDDRNDNQLWKHKSGNPRSNLNQQITKSSNHQIFKSASSNRQITQSSNQY